MIGNEVEKEFSYYYFIESHEKNKNNPNIYLSKKTIGADNLEIVQKIEDNKDYDISIFRFKFYKNKILNNLKHFEIIIIFKDKSDKFEKKINGLVIGEDNFSFDFHFGDQKGLKKKKAPNYLKLTHIEQYNYYFYYIINILKCNKESLQNKNLTTSFQKILEKKKKYNFCSMLQNKFNSKTIRFI